MVLLKDKQEYKCRNGRIRIYRILGFWQDLFFGV
jgi:hypothetical protein